MKIIPIIYKDIVEALKYSPSALWVVVCLLAALILAIGHYKSRITVGRTVLYFFFIIYIFTMLNYAFFSREPGSRIGVDLRVFATWGDTRQARAFFIENIIMFLPFGVLVPLIWEKVENSWKMILLTMVCSLLLESMQLLTQRGFFQIDDIITNSFGGICGYLFYGMVRKRST